MIKIGLDIMGGDFAPNATIQGAIEAKETWGNEIELVLLGDAVLITNMLKEKGADPGQFTLVNAPEIIGMSSSPVKSFAERPQSSMAVGFDMLRDGKIHGFCSAGNSGAMLVGAYFKVGLSREDLRPCLISILPNLYGQDGIILDVGANADCKPENLLDFAILGSTYAESVLKIKNPRVGLVNIGEEPEKGNQLSIAAHKLMAEYKRINFVGNLEGRDLFDGKADVAVCSGFVGNVILKLSEKFYEIAIHKGGKNDPFYSKFNYEQHGGSPILGVNKPVIVGHGISSSLAIKNMIRLTKEMIESSVCEKIKEAVQHA
ncbi:MAG: phosphate acyltransferase [Flavobacteriales bacterium]|nr:phosphate acyltransferase [Flavobacteriales bacterium]